MKLFRINKKSTDKIDHLGIMIDMACYDKDIKLSKTDKTVLAYILLYGYSTNTIDLISNSKIVAKTTLENTVRKIAKSGFLTKVNKTYKIAKEYDYILDDDYAILIRVKN